MATAAPASGLGTATLQYHGGNLALPLLKGSEGEVGIDIAQLRNKTGMVTFDPGLATLARAAARSRSSTASAASCATAATRSRNWREKSTFLEVAWLLIHGELPTKAELATFADAVTSHTMLHENFERFFDAMPKDAHPMAVCAAAVGALATFYQHPDADQHVHDTVTRLIAKMPTIAASSYKHSIGQPFMYPQNDLDYGANFLHMMFATPCEALRGRPGDRAGDRPAADPARRPRAELLDQHGARRGQLAGEPVRQHLAPASARSGGRCTAAPTRK